MKIRSFRLDITCLKQIYHDQIHKLKNVRKKHLAHIRKQLSNIFSTLCQWYIETDGRQMVSSCGFNRIVRLWSRGGNKWQTSLVFIALFSSPSRDSMWRHKQHWWGNDNNVKMHNALPYMQIWHAIVAILRTQSYENHFIFLMIIIMKKRLSV